MEPAGGFEPPICCLRIKYIALIFNNLCKVMPISCYYESVMQKFNDKIFTYVLENSGLVRR